MGEGNTLPQCLAFVHVVAHNRIAPHVVESPALSCPPHGGSWRNPRALLLEHTPESSTPPPSHPPPTGSSGDAGWVWAMLLGERTPHHLPCADRTPPPPTPSPLISRGGPGGDVKESAIVTVGKILRESGSRLGADDAHKSQVPGSGRGRGQCSNAGLRDAGIGSEDMVGVCVCVCVYC